jgi:hypothetical protein
MLLHTVARENELDAFSKLTRWFDKDTLGTLIEHINQAQGGPPQLESIPDFVRGATR